MLNRKQQGELFIELSNARIRFGNNVICSNSLAGIFFAAHDVEDDDIKGFIDDLDEALADSDFVASDYVSGQSLIGIINSIEIFFSEILVAVLKRYPLKMKKTKFPLDEIIAYSNDELIYESAKRTVNELMYKKPMDYLSGFCEILSINSEKLKDIWPNYIEAKARRDLGVHNNWMVNDIYLRKVSEAGIDSSVSIESSICPNFNYLIIWMEKSKEIAYTVLDLTSKVFCKDIIQEVGGLPTQEKISAEIT